MTVSVSASPEPDEDIDTEADIEEPVTDARDPAEGADEDDAAVDDGEDQTGDQETDGPDTDGPDTDERDIGEPDTGEQETGEQETDDDADPDTGATFLLDDDGSVSIDVGEDETGSVMGMLFVDSQDADPFYHVFQMRFYLAPAGTSFMEERVDTSMGNIPGEQAFFDDNPGALDYQIENFEAQNGLQLLGTVDLGADNLNVDGIDTRGLQYRLQFMPEITANTAIVYFAAEAETDDDMLLYFKTFSSESIPSEVNGAELVTTFTSLTGTDANDWIHLAHDAAPGSVLNGLGGDDILASGAAMSTLLGGEGNDFLLPTYDMITADGGAGDDSIRSYGDDALLLGGDGADMIFHHGSDATVYGGSGNDMLYMYGSGSAFGGDGNDQITADSRPVQYEHRLYHLSASGTSAGGPVTVSGGAGDDILQLRGDGTVGHGDEGNDDISAAFGATGYGGEGNDTLTAGPGGTLFGGAGDDTFLISRATPLTAEETPVVTGGAGADTYDIRISWDAPVEGAHLLRITDFDVTEDVLQIGRTSTEATVDSITLIEAADGSHTDIEVRYKQYVSPPTSETVTAVIRLDGVTGLTADQIMLT